MTDRRRGKKNVLSSVVLSEQTFDNGASSVNANVECTDEQPQAVLGLVRIGKRKMAYFYFRIRIIDTDMERSAVESVGIFRIAFRIRTHKVYRLIRTFSITASK